MEENDRQEIINEIAKLLEQLQEDSPTTWTAEMLTEIYPHAEL